MPSPIVCHLWYFSRKRTFKWEFNKKGQLCDYSSKKPRGKMLRWITNLIITIQESILTYFLHELSFCKVVFKEGKVSIYFSSHYFRQKTLKLWRFFRYEDHTASVKVVHIFVFFIIFSFHRTIEIEKRRCGCAFTCISKKAIFLFWL